MLTDREKAIAKECLAKSDTNRAKLALRRKKYQEGLIQKTDAQLAQLEQLTSDVEFALVQKDVLYGLQQGTAVLKEIHREMGGIENVEKLLGENAEARAYQEVRMTMALSHLRGCISLTSCTDFIEGDQRASCEQDVEPGRRRSRRRARSTRARGQWHPRQRPSAARRARHPARPHCRREESTTKGTRKETASGRRESAAHAGIGA